MSERIALIKRLAGNSAFANGQVLLSNNAVSQYTVLGNHIQAHVTDDSLYFVSLNVLSNGYDGGCSCPESDGFDFCRHCVAVALHHDAQESKLAALIQGSSQDKISALLQTMPRAKLESALEHLINKDKDLVQHWASKADIAFGQFDIKTLRKWVVKALPLRDVWRYELVRKYFDKARNQLALIHPLIDELTDTTALHICEFILARYDKICERVDDSGGYRFALETIIEQQYVKTFERWNAERHTKIVYLLNLYYNEFLYVDLGDIGKLFLVNASHELRCEYYVALQKEYQSNHESAPDAMHTKQMASSLALYFASQDEYLKAVEYAKVSYLPMSRKIEMTNGLINQGYLTESLTLLFELKASALPQDLQRINQMLIKVNQMQGKPDDAVQLALQQYAKNFDIALLKSLVNDHDIARSQLVTQARAIIHKQPTHRQEKLLFSLYLHFGSITDALALSQKVQLNDEELHGLAYQCLQECLYEAALKHYLNLITRNVDQGHKGYAYIIEILQEIHDEFVAQDKPLSPFYKLLNVLQDNYAKKRSFVMLLQHHFDDAK